MPSVQDSPFCILISLLEGEEELRVLDLKGTENREVPRDNLFR
jgi:hypothetical protein